MKKLSLTFIFIFFLKTLFSQGYNPLNEAVELYVGTENIPENTTLTFVLEAISTVWARDGAYAENHYLTDDYDYQTYTPSVYNNLPDDWSGFGFCDNGPTPEFGFGKYKLYEINDITRYLILDYRDNFYGHYDPYQVNSESAQDIWVKYYFDELYGGYLFAWSTSGINPSWSASEMKIWEAKNYQNPQTTKFEPYAPENLTYSITNNGKPNLHWQFHDPDDYFRSGHGISRYISINNEPPTSYTFLEPVGEFTNDYVDNAFCFSNWKNIHYNVVTRNNQTFSDLAQIQFSLVEEIINCDLTFTSDLVVPSGKILTIEAGAELTFENNAKLIVNGTLTAIGTSSNSIKFTSNSSWGGITIQSPGNGTLKYCEIENTSYGIKIYNSDPYIEQCYIHDNSYGVYVLGSSSPVFYWNTISDNTYGVKATSGATPYFGEEHTPPGTAKHGYNDIVDNNYGLYAYGSTIFLGNDMMAQIIGGRNTLDNNSTRDIHVFSSTTVWAEWNWWNGGASIYASSTSNVYKTFNYWTDPNGGSSLAKSSGESVDDSTPFDPKNMDLDNPKDVYHLALYYKYQGKTKEANELLNSILKDFSISSYSSDALIHLYDNSRRGGDIDIEEICKTKIGERAESVPQKKTSLDILASKYMGEGKLLEAEKMCEITIELYPNTENEKYALFNMFLIKRQSEDTSKEADEYKTRLEEKYPNDFVTLMAKSQSGEEVDWSKVNELGKENNDETKNTTEETVPDKYVLNPAYPNPFNPSTTLSYALPFNSSIEFIIYNLSGQVIKSFNLNSQPSGYGKVVWDGTNSNGIKVSTGIYIYRFEATSLETNEHFVKSEKLMLVK